MVALSMIYQTYYLNLIQMFRLDYHCGCELGWSPLFSFRVPRDDPQWSPQLAVYGDMGNENPQSLPRLQEETQRGLYDAILHVGDFAYDMYMVIKPFFVTLSLLLIK